MLTVKYKDQFLYYHKDGKQCKAPYSEKNLKSLAKMGYNLKPLLTLDSALSLPLYPYQYTALLQARAHAYNLLIADDMGVGKTLTAISCMLDSGSKKTIIVVPANIKYQWAHAITKAVTKSMHIFICEGQTFSENDLFTLKHSKVVLINYQILNHWQDALLKHKWDMMILDEAHKIKKRHRPRNPKWASLTVETLREKTKSVIALSGTPLTDRTADIWNVIRMVNDTIFKSEFAFEMRYCCNLEGSGKASSNTLELHKILVDSGVMIRRTKRDVYDQVPKVDIQVIPLQASSDSLKQLEKDTLELSKNARMLHGKEKGQAQFNLNKSLESYLQEAIKLKLPSIKTLIDDFMEENPDEKLVVACVHRDKCGSILHKQFKDSVLIDGSINSKVKNKLIEDFISNPNKKLLIGNVQSIGTGTDGLQTVCCTMLLCELPYSPADLKQLIARLDRNGQTRQVTVMLPVVHGSIDELLARMIDRKMNILSEVLDGETITKEDNLLTLMENCK